MNLLINVAAVAVSGQTGDDAKPYQEHQIRRAVEQVAR